MPSFINIADIVDPEDPQGRTYRQINGAKGYAIPLGSLVEVRHATYPSSDDGIRLFVAHHGRDCDETPLYWLSPEHDGHDRYSPDSRFYPASWTGGYSEESLVLIRAPQAANL